MDGFTLPFQPPRPPPFQPLGGDAVETSRMVVELLVSQIGRAGIAEDNIRAEAAAGATAAVGGAVLGAGRGVSRSTVMKKGALVKEGNSYE